MARWHALRYSGTPKACRGSRYLIKLASSSITDEGLKHLHRLTNPSEKLDLTGTKVTADGVAALQEALPKCKTVWDAAKRK